MIRALEDAVILIVDDTSENIDILNDVLKNYKRKIATSGKVALKIANSGNPPDLILLDIMMPEMDGYEVCRQLKAEPNTKDIPVIFITAMNEVQDETKGFEVGAVDFITKPISPAIVLARVKHQLELKIAHNKLQEQNEILEDKNRYITDSINYAKRIQTSILPEEEYINSIIPNHFLIFQPKDIVSGDFYWVDKIENKIIIAQVDCTGHGVPGALMAMIGNTLLNEIILMKKETDTAVILNELDRRLLEELNKEVNEDTKDGMDVALCVVDTENKRLQYSGSFRPLYYTMDNELIEIKGDRKSIGDLTKIGKKFTSSTVDLNEESIVYLFSDGIIDQNNADNKKFGSRNLKTLIKDIMNLDLKEQGELLSNSFLQHKGKELQRDDVTVIGFSLKQVYSEKNRIVLNYQNSFTHDFVVKIGEEIESQFSDSLERKEYKQLYFAVMELAQNIGHYSLDSLNKGGKSDGKGELLLAVDAKQIELSSVNLISNKSAEKLVKNLEYYNKLDRDELKKVLKTKLKSDSEEDSKGAGIGFIEIIKRTGNPIEYSINKIDENKSQLKLSVKITLGESNG